MKANIYQFKSYKEYVNSLLDSAPTGSRGQRRKLADAIKSQVSHITNVLSGPAHFSPEQCEAVAKYFGLGFEETEYLLLLVQENRAGTKSLRDLYNKILAERRTANNRLKLTLAIHDQLTESQQTTYYSSWHYSAIHVLLSIPGFNTREAIANRLLLPMATVDGVLQCLLEAGLCERSGVQFRQLRPLLHLDRSSPHILRHHTNWRLHAIHTPHMNSTDSLRYSGIVSLSKDELQKVKNILNDSLSKAMDLIKKSPEEELAAINLDFYRV